MNDSPGHFPFRGIAQFRDLLAMIRLENDGKGSPDMVACRVE